MLHSIPRTLVTLVALACLFAGTLAYMAVSDNALDGEAAAVGADDPRERANRKPSGTPPPDAECTVSVVIESVRIVTATDRDGNDFLNWDQPFVTINQVSQSAEGFITPSHGGRGGLDENKVDKIDHEIFNGVVGKKGDPVNLAIVLSNREIDLRVREDDRGNVIETGASDEGFGFHSEQLVDQCRDVKGGRNLIMTVKVTPIAGPTGPATETEDKNPPVNGLVEIKIHADIDP